MKFVALFSAFLFSFSFLNAQTVIYVDKDAAQGGNGSNWSSSFKYLNDAFSYANNNSGTYQIWVAEGTYFTDEGALYSNDDQNSVFNIPSNVSSLIGGFSGNEQSEDQANPKQYLTKLSGLIFEEYGATGIGSSYLFTAAGDNSLTVSGFSFNNSSDQDGCILNLSSSNNITFEFCNFSDNQSTENLIQANQNTVFRNCRFERNQTSDGYLIAFGDFESCFFNENVAYTNLIDSAGIIDRSIISNNVSSYNYSSIIYAPSTIVNSVIFRNRGGEYIIRTKSGTQLLNSTFVDNYNFFTDHYSDIQGGVYTVGNCIFFRSAFNNSSILSNEAVVGYKSEVNLPVQSAFFGILDYYRYSSRSSSFGSTYLIELSGKVDQMPYRGSSVFQNTFFKVFEAVLPEQIIGFNPYTEDGYNELINNSKKLFGFSLCNGGDSYLPEFTKEFDIEYPDPFINSSDPLGPDGEPFTEDDGLRLDPNSEWASEVINVPTIDADYELTDILGNNRIIGDLIDLGAYEYMPLEDADGDGISDSNDAFPNNANETLDTDGDGLGDNEDSDDDGDGVDDSVEIATGTDPKQYNSALHSFVQTLGGGTFDADDIAESRLAGQSDVTSDPNTFNLFTQAELTSATEAGNTQGQNAVTSDPNSFGLFSSDDISVAQSQFRILGQWDVVSDPLSYGLYSPSYTVGLIDASREAGREDVTSDPSAYGLQVTSGSGSDSSSVNLYSLEEIVDLRPGSTMIEIQNGQATLTMEVEQSDDLGVWTNGSATSIQIPIDAEAGKKFFRFKMSE